MGRGSEGGRREQYPVARADIDVDLRAAQQAQTAADADLKAVGRGSREDAAVGFRDTEAEVGRGGGGIAEGGKRLILVVVDGRNKEKAVGMSLAELSRIMLGLNCESALNLDGGGSSVIVLRDPKTGEQEILNHPSDGRERAVANVLGVDVGEIKSRKAQ